MFETVDLEVCTVCVHIIANGEYNDGTDTGDRVADAQVALWGDAASRLVLGDVDEDRGFSSAECDGCGNGAAGDRYAAAVLIPHG